MQKKISTSLVASLFLATTNLFSAQSLEPITVTTATKSTQSIKDLTSNVEIITKEEIEEKHFTTVSEALSTLSGVGVTGNGGLGNSSNVYLRGMESKRVLVLIDGIRYNDVTSASGAPFEHLMMNDIEQIEVVKGAQSGIWGADASAGVINIITKSSKTGTHGDALVEYGSFNTKKYGMNLSHRTDKFYLKGAISETDTDGYSSFVAKKNTANYGKRGDELYLEKDGYQNITGSVKAGYNFNDSNKIDLSHTIIDADGNFDNTTSDSLNTTSTKDNFSILSFENRNSFATTELYGKKSVFDRIYYYPATDSKTDFDGEVKEYGVKSNIPYLNENSFVILGADYKNFEHKNAIGEDYSNDGIFLTNSNKFFDKTTFTQSVRTDNYDKFEDKKTGKIGIKQEIIEDLSISSNYGTAYNVPTLYNLYSQYGNKDLIPENTKGYDVSIAYLGFSATYFDNKVKDMIDYYDPTPRNTRNNDAKYINSKGESDLDGYELAYKQNVLEDLIFNVNHTHLIARSSDGLDLSRRAKRESGFGVDYYGINRFHFNINGSYIGDRYDGANKTGASTGNYTVWNSVVNYEINKTFSTYIKLDNLFDKYYQTIDGYATAERSGYLGFKASF